MNRLDGGCRAKILHQTNDEVMLTASWPASKQDERKFNVVNGIASNTVVVSRDYFNLKYGAR